MNIYLNKHTNDSKVPYLIPTTEGSKILLNKLNDSEEYLFSHHKVRDLESHKKFFAMIKMCLHHMPEKYEGRLQTKEQLIHELKLQTGRFKMQISITGKEYPLVDSMNFVSMDEVEFKKFRSECLDIIIRYLIPESNRNELEEQYLGFM